MCSAPCEHSVGNTTKKSEKHEKKHIQAVIDPVGAVTAISFTDVPSDAWYYDYVNNAASKGLIQGTGNNEFAPGNTLSRAEAAAVVWRFYQLANG